jgi:hypothetical protein
MILLIDDRDKQSQIIVKNCDPDQLGQSHLLCIPSQSKSQLSGESWDEAFEIRVPPVQGILNPVISATYKTSQQNTIISTSWLHSFVLLCS